MPIALSYTLAAYICCSYQAQGAHTLEVNVQNCAPARQVRAQIPGMWDLYAGLDNSPALAFKTEVNHASLGRWEGSHRPKPQMCHPLGMQHQNGHQAPLK